MWIRRRPDLQPTDYFSLLSPSALVTQTPSCRSLVSPNQPDLPTTQCLGGLSVRSLLHLYLSAVRLPPGSEVLMSSPTLPDMVRIVQHHGLTPVGLPIDWNSLQLTGTQVRNAIRDSTRMLIHAPLFGAQPVSASLIDVCQRAGILFVEDCAQAFSSAPNARLEAAIPDATLYSFGPIKTHTSLAGGLARIRDPEILTTMTSLQNGWPRQSSISFLKRAAVYAGMQTASARGPCSLLFRILDRSGQSADKILSSMTRGFGERPDVLRFEQSPSGPLRRLLSRRLSPIRLNKLHRRQKRRLENIRTFLAALKAECPPDLAVDSIVPGLSAEQHAWWVLPVRAPNREELRETLKRIGFDTAQRGRLDPVPCSEEHRADSAPHATAESLANDLIFLPHYEQIPQRAMQQAAGCVAQHLSGTR